MQGTLVGSLVWEDPTCHRATKPVCHNYQAQALDRLWALTTKSVLRQEKPRQQEVQEPVKSSPHWWQPEKALVQQRRPTTAKIEN